MDKDLVDLQELVGPDVFQKILDRFAGERIYIPANGDRLNRNQIHQRVKITYQEMSGTNVMPHAQLIKTLAKHFGYSVRQINRIARGK